MRYSKLKTIMAAVCTATAGTMTAYDARSINDGWEFRFEDEQTAIPVHLPHCWNGDAYRTRDYRRGTGIYTRTLLIPELPVRGQVYLRLDGAANKSKILIDGDSIAAHTGAYSTHTVNITKFITPGRKHMLSVEVDNADKNIPPSSADFSFMGGLYRDAWLLTTDDIHFDLQKEKSLRITPVAGPGETCSLSVSGNVMNSGFLKGHAIVEVRLESPDGKIVACATEKTKLGKTGESVSFHIKLDKLADIKLWSPETPELYKVCLSLKDGDRVCDSRALHTGFRTFGFDTEGRFLLNGKPYKLRGMCRHQDQAPMGIALSDDQHRRDMRMIKDMGANFIRISHYPQDDAVLEMCDRLGLIAWEEIPVIDFVPDCGRFADNCEIMLREMISDHFNHPSIAMWGYMNEILLRMPNEGREDVKDRTIALACRLEKAARQEDPGRMTAMAFHGSDVYNDTGLAEITDVKGWNLYSGWYGGKPEGFEEFLSDQHRKHPDHRLIVSEYGAGSDRRLHSLDPEPFDFSMEYQQLFLEHYLPVIEDSTFVAGASHWNFIDFSSANRAESMPHINNKGLVANDRTPKDVYYYYKSAWSDPESGAMAHIASRDWAERTEITDRTGNVVRPVKVYSNLPAIILKANGTDSGPVRTENYNAVFPVRLSPGRNVLEVYNPGNMAAPLDAMTINLTPLTAESGVMDLSTEEMAVNVGSNCYYRSGDSGLTWLPDREYRPGGHYGHIGGERRVSQDEISLTADTPLLQRCLYGLDEYRIDLLPGKYEVELTFAELSSPSRLSAYMLGHNAGNGDNAPSCMDIRINGKEVETGFSPAAVSGTKSKVTRRYSTEVGGDRCLSVQFTPSSGGTTSLASIKIRKQQ